MKTIVIFGSTGSIGKQSLEVLREFPNQFQIIGLFAKSSKELLTRQAAEFQASSQLGLSNKQEFIDKADYIINGVPGFAGLEISVATLRAGKTLLSANKESLAIAGRYLRQIAEENSAEIFPLDSEASAIWQLIHQTHNEAKGEKKKKHKIKSVTVTCSGGPFFGKTADELKNVTVEQALAHPTWKMGPKVSLDSATLINKVLEVYEVHNLFDIPLRDIYISIHPQSLVHSMIHTQTGATKMHITQNDMRLFISYALHYPNQPDCPWPILRAKRSEMNFNQPDPKTFRSLTWLKQHGGNPNFPIILNAMNDLASTLFLSGKISFLGIYDLIEEGLDKYLYELPPKSLEELILFHNHITNDYRNTACGRQFKPSKAGQIAGKN